MTEGHTHICSHAAKESINIKFETSKQNPIKKKKVQGLGSLLKAFATEPNHLAETKARQ